MSKATNQEDENIINGEIIIDFRILETHRVLIK
jgi:hypothetical protein